MKLVIIILTSFSYCCSMANNDSINRSYNIHSNYNVSEKDILWRRTITRLMDLREPRNEGFYASQQELTQDILKAALSGEIKIYTSDSLSYGNSLSIEQFKNNLIPQRFESQFEKSDLDYLENSEDFSALLIGETSNDTICARDIYQIEIREELIFDSKHSRMINDIISFKLILSSDHPLNILGIDQTIGVFSYKELSTKIFNKPTSNMFYLAKNLSQPISFDQAIKLNYHFAPIVKLNNSEGLYLSDQCDCSLEEQLWKSLELEYNIKEYEYKFWVLE